MQTKNTPKKITKKMLGRIIHDLGNRATWTELEERYGFEPGELRRYCKERNITRRDVVHRAKENRKPSSPSAEMLAADVQHGLSVTSIAKKYDVTYQAAHFWLRQNGLRVNRAKNPPPPIQELIDMIKYFGINETARKYGTTAAIVNGWRQRYGLLKKTKKRKYSIPENVREYALQQYYLGLWDEADIAEEYGIPVLSVEADILESALTENMVQLMPDRKDLAAEAETMSIRELAKWYGTTQSQVLRWFEALSIKQGEK